MSSFDTIPQDKLLEKVGEHVSDGAVLELVERFLKQGVMESGKDWKPTELGTPQGAVISPLLANIYLNPLDHLMAGQGQEMVRYADDFVILCESEAEAQEVMERLRQWVAGVGLVLHPTKTRIVDATPKGGFDFLGYHFERGYRWPREKSLDRFKATIREKTGRCRPESMETIIKASSVKTRRKFDPAFKLEVVRNWQASGKSAAVVAKELGLAESRPA